MLKSVLFSVFNVSDDASVCNIATPIDVRFLAFLQSARSKLEPPHYDGVQSLALKGKYLFSGSRDNSIKKWNIETQQLVQVCVLFNFRAKAAQRDKHHKNVLSAVIQMAALWTARARTLKWPDCSF